MSCISCLFTRKCSSTSMQFDEDIYNVRQFTYKELRNATDDFSHANKIGEGGFGSVYKGKLKDGAIVAIKVLSAESKQGPREFLNELKMIADISHENLVKLYGCCVEGEHRILLYNYLENNSLSRTLLCGGHCDIEFKWKVRKKICIDIARGLTFLHEELTPHIVHRDIKASNILLDADLNAKISDFGLAKLIPSNVTHVSTRVAGTIGYLAPEYAVRGHLTRKADIYSFGVLLLEIVSGRCNTNTKLPSEDRFLLERSSIMPSVMHGLLLLQIWLLYERNELPKIVDSSLEDDFDVDEATRFLKVGLLCSQDSPKLRPTMSTVVKMLTGEKSVNMENVTKPGLVQDFMEFKVRNPKSSGATSTNITFSGPDSSEVCSTFPSLTFTAISDREG